MCREPRYLQRLHSIILRNMALPRFWKLCVFLITVTILAWCRPAAAQEVPRARLVPIEDGVYEYIERLQRRGFLLELNPTALPYTSGKIADAVERVYQRDLDPASRRWLDLIADRIGYRRSETDDLLIGAELRAGSRFTTTRRLDLLRPSGDDEAVMPFTSIRGYATSGPWAIQLGVTHDRYYVVDPDGIKSVLRLQARNEENYVGIDTRYATLYLGRFTHHWGQPGRAGLFISDNPRSYDLISFRLGSERLALRSVLGELDAMTSDQRFTGRAFEEGSVRRFLAAHRVDWRPRPNIAVSFLESGLFSGGSSGFSLKYLNPIQVFIFAIDNQPKNDENKGLVGGNLWMQFGRTTINGQILVDDVDIMGQTSEPISMALAGSAVFAGIVPALDAGVSLELVTARTYNTHQREGQYLYLLRGLATNFSDYIHGALFTDFYADALLGGLRLSPRVDVMWQGEFDMRDPYPANVGDVGTILKGDEERTIRLSLPIRYQPSTYFWISADPGLNLTSNVDHVAGSSRSRFVGMAAFGVRLPLDRSVGPLF